MDDADPGLMREPLGEGRLAVLAVLAFRAADDGEAAEAAWRNCDPDMLALGAMGLLADVILDDLGADLGQWVRDKQAELLDALAEDP